MMETEINKILKEIKGLAKNKLPDSQIHIIKFPLEDIAVCVFWNHSTGSIWNNSNTFKFNIKNYEDELKNSIKPFFENFE